MHEPGLGLVHPGVVEVVEDGDHDLQHLAALEDVVEELLVVLAQLPEEDEQLLVEVEYCTVLYCTVLYCTWWKWTFFWEPGR